MKKLIDNIRYKISKFLLKISVILYTDYYVDQFQTLNTRGKYGDVYIRLDRNLPDSEKEYSLKI